MTEEEIRFARRAREAAALLGWDSPACMPGEAAPCGLSIRQHIAAYLGTIQALADHHLEHWDDADRESAVIVRTGIAADLRERNRC